MAIEKICYYCGERATTREHVPPKGFFPRKANLQPKTVPSCTKHNNAKSTTTSTYWPGSAYMLARATTYRKGIFLNSIKPQLEFSPKRS
jgi:hypothetical protein